MKEMEPMRKKSMLQQKKALWGTSDTTYAMCMTALNQEKKENATFSAKILSSGSLICRGKIFCNYSMYLYRKLHPILATRSKTPERGWIDER